MTKLKDLLGEELAEFKARYKKVYVPLVYSEKIKNLCDCIRSSGTTPLNDARKAINLIQGDNRHG